MVGVQRQYFADVGIGRIDCQNLTRPRIAAVYGATRPWVVCAVDEENVLLGGIDPVADTRHQLAAIPLTLIEFIVGYRGQAIHGNLLTIVASDKAISRQQREIKEHTAKFADCLDIVR